MPHKSEALRGGAEGQIVKSFPDHRTAALALLNDEKRLSRKEGGFLGNIAVDPSALSEAQAAWLVNLLNRTGLPSLVEGSE